MAIIKCKMCGGDIDLAPDKSYGVCEFCGSTMTLPKVDDEQRAAAFNRGNHFRRIGEFDKALTVYESLVRENEADAEAHWCCALCRFGIEYVKDPASGEYLPTCHRASFDSFLEDVDTKEAIEHADAVAKRQYERDAQVIEEVRRGILTLSQNEKPYDVFLCYKETDDKGQRTIDSQRAQEIYYQLTDQGRRVFFARITLEDKAGQQYEPYIFAALNSAKVMIVVGTRREHLEAVWVKNEWSRFLAIMKRDRKKLLIPCYAEMDPYDMPEQLSVLQSYDMTKIGFLQDLTRGISKVLDEPKKQEPSAAPQGQSSAASGSVAALLKRGYMALEDGDWARADEFFEQVLNLDAECAEAYLGKVLAEYRVPSLQAFVQSRQAEGQVEEETIPVTIDPSYVDAAAERYTTLHYLSSQEIRQCYTFQTSYTSTVRYWTAAKEEEEDIWRSDRQITRAFQYAKGPYRQELEDARQAVIDFYDRKLTEATAQSYRDKAACEQERNNAAEAADQKAAALYDEALQQQERDYVKACQAQAEAEQAGDAQQLKELVEKFAFVGNYYKDCKKRKDHCEQLSQEIFVRQAEARTRLVLAWKKRILIAASCVTALLVVVLVAVLVVTKIIIPTNSYKAAEELLAAGDYDGAIAAFEALGNYKDAPERADYIQAEELLAAGDRPSAAIAFGKAGDYQDARARSMELWNQVAQRESVAAGDRHTVGLRSDGTVVATGENEYGQCDTESWSDIVAVAAGCFDTVGLRSDGTVVAIGSNAEGQRDVSDWTDIVAVAAGGDHTAGLRLDGTVVAVGQNDDGRCDVSDWTDIVAVAAGDRHTVGLRSDGTVVATGENEYGQCDTESWSDIVAVAAGCFDTVGLRSDGTVVAIGSNAEGQRDVSDWTDIVAVAAGGDHTAGLRLDGTVVAVGQNDDGRCDVSDWTDIVAVAAGDRHTVGLRSDGTVVAAGNNNPGQCNVSGWTDIKLPG